MEKPANMNHRAISLDPQTYIEKKLTNFHFIIHPVDERKNFLTIPKDKTQKIIILCFYDKVTRNLYSDIFEVYFDKIPLQNIYIASSTFNAKEGFLEYRKTTKYKDSLNFIYFDFWVNDMLTRELFKIGNNDNYQDEGVADTVDIKTAFTTLDREKHFLCYNRYPRRHRIALITRFLQYDLLEKGFVSCIGKTDMNFVLEDTGYNWHDNNLEKNTEISQENLWYLKQLSHCKDSKILQENFLKLELPMFIDTERLDRNLNWNNEKNTYLNSWFSVVTETEFFKNHMAGSTKKNPVIFFSEKIYKPMVNLHPFILVGNYKGLEKLRADGFLTFSPFIDESYDDIFDDDDRLNAIAKEVERLCKMSQEEMKQWFLGMKEILIHNKNHMVIHNINSSSQFDSQLYHINNTI